MDSGSNDFINFRDIMIELREERRWSKAELARRAVLDESTIHYIETGKKNPNFITMQKIATGFGMDITELLKHKRTNIEIDVKNKSELIEWALNPDNKPYLEFIYNLSKEVKADELQNLKINLVKEIGGKNV